MPSLRDELAAIVDGYAEDGRVTLARSMRNRLIDELTHASRAAAKRERVLRVKGVGGMIVAELIIAPDAYATIDFRRPINGVCGIELVGADEPRNAEHPHRDARAEERKR